VRRITVPVAWKTASKEELKFDPRSRIEESEVLEPLVEADGQVAGLLHGPLAGRMGGDAAKMHPAGVVLDEHQDIQPFQQHRVHVQEVHREYPGGLDEATTLINLGQTQHALDDSRAARSAWEQALAILADLHHPDAEQLRAHMEVEAADDGERLPLNSRHERDSESASLWVLGR